MAQPLQALNIVAPGFMGLNTEESPIAIDPAYATTADNCVIDKYGRLAARLGAQVVTTDKTELGSSSIKTIGQFRDSAGNTVIFSAGNNKILSGTTTLVDETPGSYTISADLWTMVNFNDHMYFFQEDHAPLVYSNSLGAVVTLASHPSYSGTAPQAGVALGAFGRLWAAIDNTVYWSDLLNGAIWDTGTSGSIDLTKVWPEGDDEVTALAAHNNLLIIFGKHSIVAYEGATSPSTMVLADTVAGVGCVAKDSVQSIGTDVLFLSSSGLRSFGRAVQEKSLPINDLSKNIKKDIITLAQVETDHICSVYSPENSFYLICFPSSTTVYCFDLKGTLQNGAYRVTRWPSNYFESFFRLVDGTVYIGTSDGINKYAGYTDGSESYAIVYYSPYLSFGDPTKLKIPKKLKPTIVGGSGEDIAFKWGYAFSGAFKSQIVTMSQVGNVGYFGQSEFNVAEYAGGVSFQTFNINTTGSGNLLMVGLETTVSEAMSLQEYNVLTLVGEIN